MCFSCYFHFLAISMICIVLKIILQSKLLQLYTYVQLDVHFSFVLVNVTNIYKIYGGQTVQSFQLHAVQCVYFFTTVHFLLRLYP